MGRVRGTESAAHAARNAGGAAGGGRFHRRPIQRPSGAVVEGGMTMAETTLKRHPIRGFLWGLITGAGIGLLLMVLSVVPLSIPTLIIYTVTSAVLGALWGMFAP